jgi:hypothetical protein
VPLDLADPFWLDPPLVLQLRAFKVSEHGKEEEVTVE